MITQLQNYFSLHVLFVFWLFFCFLEREGKFSPRHISKVIQTIHATWHLRYLRDTIDFHAIIYFHPILIFIVGSTQGYDPFFFRLFLLFLRFLRDLEGELCYLVYVSPKLWNSNSSSASYVCILQKLKGCLKKDRLSKVFTHFVWNFLFAITVKFFKHRKFLKVNIVCLLWLLLYRRTGTCKFKLSLFQRLVNTNRKV